MKKRTLVGIAALTVSVGICHATIIAEDLFDYAEGTSAMGASGGTGFSDAWSSDADGTLNIESGRPHMVPTTGTTESYRTLTTALTDGDDVWIGITLDMDSTDHTRFYGLSPFNGGSERGLLGMSAQQEWMYFDNSGAGAVLSGVDPLTGNPGPVRLVLNLTLQAGDDALKFWVVDEGGTIDVNAPLQDVALGDVGSVTRLRLAGGTGNGTTSFTSSGLMDDLQIGTEAGDVVTAIPEPATLGLVAIFGGATLFIRRKLMM